MYVFIMHTETRAHTNIVCFFHHFQSAKCIIAYKVQQKKKNITHETAADKQTEIAARPKRALYALYIYITQRIPKRYIRRL